MKDTQEKRCELPVAVLNSANDEPDHCVFVALEQVGRLEHVEEVDEMLHRE